MTPELFHEWADLLPDAILTIDHEGKLVEFNPAAELLFGYRRADVLGREMAELIVPPALRDAHRGGLAHYLATGEGPILNRRVELPAVRADGTVLTVELAVVRIPRTDPPLFTGYLRDIGERHKAERHRNVRLAVTQALAWAASAAEAAPGVLQAVCENLGWDVGVFWAIDRAAGDLHCLAAWHRPAVESAAFEAASRGRRFGSGEGLPGRVWVAGRPVWVADVSRDDNFPRAADAARDGLHAAFGCPVAVGGETLGVVEFFHRQIQEPDGDLLELMGTLGGLVGQFLRRTLAEQDLRESEQRFRQLAEHVAAVFYVADLQTPRVLYVNPAYEIVWGRTARSLYDDPHSFAEVVHPDDRERVQARWDRHARGEPTADEYRVIRPDGSVRWVWDRGFPVRDESGRVVRVVGLAEDVTERKRDELALRFLADAGEVLSALVDSDSTLQKVANLAVPFFADWCAVDLTEPDGTVRRAAVAHVDPEKVRLAREVYLRFPPGPGDPPGAPSILGAGGSEVPDALLEAAARDEEHLRLLRQLGLRSYLGVPLEVRGQPVGAITFVTAESGRRYDATDLAYARELARRAGVAVENARLYAQVREADRRKDEFLAMLAHELRNPLAPIRNALHVLKQPNAPAAVAEKARSMMERQVQHLVRLVDDLLDVSRIMRGKVELRREPVELAAVVARAVETTQPVIDARGHAFTVTLPPAPIWLEADPVRLAQVIANLLNNAAKYTERGGRIALTAELANGGRQPSEVVLRVRDTGIGIDPATLTQIFELFVQEDRSLTRAQGGLGIGLTLVRSLVELHGGRVEAHSAGPGKGSEFVVWLPVSGSGSRIPDPGAETADPGIRNPKRRVLVVDDNVDAAESLAAVLRLGGQEVRLAHSGSEALAAAAEFRPEVVLLDIGMPVMDGYEVARRLRQQPGLERMVLAALTGWGQEDDRRRSREAGFDYHFVKPVEPGDLARVLGAAGRP